MSVEEQDPIEGVPEDAIVVDPSFMLVAYQRKNADLLSQLTNMEALANQFAAQGAMKDKEIADLQTKLRSRAQRRAQPKKTKK